MSRVGVSKDEVRRAGGLYTGRVSITEAKVTTAQWGENTVCGLKITYAKPDGSEGYDFIANGDSLQPDRKGVAFELKPGADPKHAKHGRDMAPFVDALCDSGFDVDSMDGDFSTLEGNDFDLRRPTTIGQDGNPVLSKKRVNERTGQGYPVTHVILAKWLGETGVEPEGEEAVDPSTALVEALKSAISKTPKIPKSSLKGILNREMASLPNKVRSEALAIADNATKLANVVKVAKLKLDKSGTISK